MSDGDIRNARLACERYDSGIYDARDVCQLIVFGCGSGAVTQRLDNLPPYIVALLREWAARLPLTEQGWGEVFLGGMLDGGPGDYERMRSENRKKAEAVRQYFQVRPA